MHAKNISHRDMKPDNVIYNPQTRVVKIIDFGFACISREKLKVFCGTPSFMSPEIVSKQPYSGPASDIWACGVLLYACLTGMVPFKAQTEKELFRKIQRGVYSYTMQSYATMMAQKASAASQLNNFNSSLQPQIYRQQSGAQIILNGQQTNVDGGTSTPAPLSQQVAVSPEAKSVIKSLLTVNEDQRPSAIEILFSSNWVQSQMSQDDLETLSMIQQQLQEQEMAAEQASEIY